jgi:transcriptional regulator with XRE-family HTH domain
MTHMSEPLAAEASKDRAALANAQPTIGQRLRARREEQGLSLREFARRLGASPSAISKIETDKYRPSVSTLWAIVSELGMSLDELFGQPAESPRSGAPTRPRERRPDSFGQLDESPRSRQRAQRADSRKAIELDSGVRWERLTANVDREADFLFVRYDVGGSSSPNDAFVRHSGREYGLLLTGTLEVTVGFETYILGPGDSISFESTTPHRLRNVSDEVVTGVWVVIGRHGDDPLVGPARVLETEHVPH